MLEYVHLAQPTLLYQSPRTFARANGWICAVILRVSPQVSAGLCFSASFCVNTWIYARRSADRDLERAFVRRKENAWICASQTTDRDLHTT